MSQQPDHHVKGLSGVELARSNVCGQLEVRHLFWIPSRIGILYAQEFVGFLEAFILGRARCLLQVGGDFMWPVMSYCIILINVVSYIILLRWWIGMIGTDWNDWIRM